MVKQNTTIATIPVMTPDPLHKSVSQVWQETPLWNAGVDDSLKVEQTGWSCNIGLEQVLNVVVPPTTEKIYF